MKTYRIVVPHGDTHMKFGLLQETTSGALYGSSPCCGVRLKDSALCTFCSTDWDGLAGDRMANCVSGFRFVSDDSDAFAMNDVISTWIQRLLGFEEYSTDCKVEVDWD